MDICNSISELAYLSGIELTATLDTKVGLLKAMDILDENFDCHTADAGQQEKNFRLVEKIIEEKKNANFINIVHHVPICCKRTAGGRGFAAGRRDDAEMEFLRRRRPEEVLPRRSRY